MKQCRHCKLEIHDEARLCHHCKSNQGWVANQQDIRMMVATFVVMGLIAAVAISVGMYFSRDSSSSTPALTISTHTHRFSSAQDGNHLFILGKVKNTSQATASDIWFRVSLFSADTMLDDLLLQENGLVVTPGTTETFRLTTLVAPAESEVTRVDVTIYRVKPLRK